MQMQNGTNVNKEEVKMSYTKCINSDKRWQIEEKETIESVAKEAVEQINQLSIRNDQAKFEIGEYLYGVIGNDRSEYGQRVMKTIAMHKGLPIKRSMLYDCLSVAKFFPNVRASGQLHWSHYALLSRIDDSVLRLQLEANAIKGKWSWRELKAMMPHNSFRPHTVAGKIRKACEKCISINKILEDLTRLPGSIHAEAKIEVTQLGKFVEGKMMETIKCLKQRLE